MTDIIEGTAVEETGTEMIPHSGGTLIRSENPLEFIRRATEIAEALSEVIRQKGLVSVIQGREHVQVEAWTLCGSILGVFPVVEWTRPTADGWEARVVAQTLAGQQVGSAEAMCTRAERTWAKRDDYAIRSMAQTRAVSKALRQPLGFIMSLAGFVPTPLEEMEGHDPQPKVEREFDPANDLLEGAPHGRNVGKEAAEMLKAVDPTVAWAEMLAAATSACFGKERQGMTADETRMFWHRFANVARRISLACDGNAVPPVTDAEIVDAFAWAFGGAVVEVVRLPDDLPNFGEEKS
jgi:hypothetical protein